MKTVLWIVLIVTLLAMYCLIADWQTNAREDIPELVPYTDLEQLERDKDAAFIASCEIVRQLIYNEKEI
jgi:hypothetical protein